MVEVKRKVAGGVDEYDEPDARSEQCIEGREPIEGDAEAHIPRGVHAAFTILPPESQPHKAARAASAVNPTPTGAAKLRCAPTKEAENLTANSYKTLKVSRLDFILTAL